MAQHDFNLANASGAAFRSDLNNALSAIATTSSGASAPSTTFAYQFWFDTTANILKIRDGANTAWVNVASLSGTTWTPYRAGVLLGTAAVVNTGNTDANVPTNANLKASDHEFTRTQNFNATSLTDAANIAWDAQKNQVAQVTLAGNRTLDNPTLVNAGAVYILRVVQDGTGSRTLAYGSAYKFPGGAAPVLSTGANDVDVLTFLSDGTNMFGVIQQDFS